MNTTAKHTPGPWLASNEDPDGLKLTTSRRIVANGKTVARVFNSLPNLDANAALIASAPSMLEALKKAAHYFELRNLGEPAENIHAETLSVIAKAEGRS